MLNLETHIEHNSMFNTSPVFTLYTTLLYLEWLQDHGGVEWAEKENIKKSNLLYTEIDKNPLLEGFAEKEDRSLVNATFALTDEKIQKQI